MSAPTTVTSKTLHHPVTSKKALLVRKRENGPNWNRNVCSNMVKCGIGQSASQRRDGTGIPEQSVGRAYMRLLGDSGMGNSREKEHDTSPLDGRAREHKTRRYWYGNRSRERTIIWFPFPVPYRVVPTPYTRPDVYWAFPL